MDLFGGFGGRLRLGPKPVFLDILELSEKTFPPHRRVPWDIQSTGPPPPRLPGFWLVFLMTGTGTHWLWRGRHIYGETGSRTKSVVDQEGRGSERVTLAGWA